MAKSGADVVQSVDEADKYRSQNSQTDLQALSSPSTEFQERNTHNPLIKAKPIPTEKDNLLQAAYIVLHTVPRAIEDFIEREYKGGFLQAIHDHKDHLRAKLCSEEWDLFSQIIVHHRLYHVYDRLKQDAILDKEVLDLLISRCILKIEDRAEIEQHPRQSERNKCILDLLIQRPQDSFIVLLDVLKESHTCSTDLIEYMEGQQLSHHKVVSQSKVKSSITGYHSVTLQKNYHHLIQNLSEVRNVIDSLISNGVLEPDDHAAISSSGVPAEMNRKLIAKIRSEQDYLFLLEALKEDSVSANAELASDLESTDICQNELKLRQTANVPQLTNRPGFQSLVTLVTMVKAVQISDAEPDTEPESHDTSLTADLYRLQSWYKKIIKMSSMDSDKYQQFVQTVIVVLERINQKNDPCVKETILSTVIQKQVQRMLDSLKEKEENSERDEKLKKMETEVDEIIPKNIRELIKNQIKDWEKKDKMFVSTRASKYVMERLQDHSCLTLTAPSGVGKSFIARHAALLLKKEGYNIIPVYSPTDIRTYYQPGKQTVFVVDDICGNFTANQQQIDNWEQMLPVIDRVIADKCCKIIVSCRLQVYKDDKFNILLPFKSCECNLISDKLCLTSVEKIVLAKTYIGSFLGDIDKLSLDSEFFPLLCSLYDGDKNKDLNDFFKNPFNVYQNELDNLCWHGDDGILRICSLALCVIYNNQLEEKWFKGKLTDEQKHIIEDICDAVEINRITSKTKLKKALDTLDGTFISNQNGFYKIVHDKLFDFLAHYFGQKMIECLIDHGESGLVHERFIWQKSPDDKNSNIDFIIEIPEDYLESYLVRLVKDWSAGKGSDVFGNTNLKVSLFRQKLLQYLKQLHKSKQVTLVNTKDIVKPKEDCASGNTPLVCSCYYGYTDIVQWLLSNDVDVDQCRDDGNTGLIFASQNGHTDIVKLLLEKDPNVDLCDKEGCSPLSMASQEVHTDIVKLLLQRNPNVNLCTKDGRSPLYMASQEGHNDIVNLLLKKDSYINLCNKYGFTPLIMACGLNHTNTVKLLMKHKPNINAQTYDGGNALYFSAVNGNMEITKLLLENNADCNICINSKQSITDTFNNHPRKTLDKEKQELFDSLVKNTSSHGTDYVSKKSVDYGFDVVAGSSPLHIACFIGRIDVVHCLLDHNANINITKEDGTTPLFYACEVGHEDIVHLLLDKGADTQMCRLDGKSPLDIATDNGHTSIVVMVTNHIKKED